MQLGQRVQAGAPLMSVIALNQVWVEANFKESQLKSLRLEQPVTLEADVYGKKVEYHGTVEGLGAGTGAAFALLPAQNATGNWIKVVQRVPVRVRLDPKELVEHPLRVGLSMDAKVDIRNTGGRMLAAEGARRAAVAQTHVFEQNSDAADLEVQRIIAANRGRGTVPDFASNARPQALVPHAADAAHAALLPASAAASVATLAGAGALQPAATALK